MRLDDLERRWLLAFLISLLAPPILYLACFWIDGFMQKVLWGSSIWTMHGLLAEWSLMFLAALIPGLCAGRWCGGAGFLLLPSTFVIFLGIEVVFNNYNTERFVVGLIWLAGAIPSLMLSIPIGMFLRRRAKKS